MNHGEIINWILTVEFAFNHFIKCLLIFECFESSTSKSLLKNVCGEDKQDCFNIFLGQVSSPTKSQSNCFCRILLLFGFQKMHQPLPGSNFSKKLEQRIILYHLKPH